MKEIMVDDEVYRVLRLMVGPEQTISEYLVDLMQIDAPLINPMTEENRRELRALSERIAREPFEFMASAESIREL
jgi:predicted CopG family antitoxin